MLIIIRSEALEDKIRIYKFTTSCAFELREWSVAGNSFESMLEICCAVFSLLLSVPCGLFFQMSLYLNEFGYWLLVGFQKINKQMKLIVCINAHLKLTPNKTIIVNPIVSAKHFFSENFGNRIFLLRLYSRWHINNKVDHHLNYFWKCTKIKQILIGWSYGKYKCNKTYRVCECVIDSNKQYQRQIYGF